jgi:ABC-type uncharacterized transport system auxiliary subunit
MGLVKLMVCALAAAAILAACSDGPSAEQVDASLKAATAAAVPGADARSIEVLNPQRSPASWRWNARIDNKVYACDADNEMRLPACEATT